MNKEDYEKLSNRAKIRYLAKQRGLKGRELDHFMAQVRKESNFMKKPTEDPNYTVFSMRKQFAKGRTLKDGTVLKRDHWLKNKDKYKSEDFKYTDEDLKKISPRYRSGGTADTFFDFAYSDRKDLGTGPGEGKDMYGIGAIHLTGKHNRKKYGIETEEDREKMIKDIEFSTNKSIDYFKDVTKNLDLDKVGADKVTEKVNKETDADSYAARRKYFQDEVPLTDYESKAPEHKFSTPEEILEKIKERVSKNKEKFKMFTPEVQ